MVNREMERGMQAGITRSQRHGGFFVAQSTERFNSTAKVTRPERDSEFGGV